MKKRITFNLTILSLSAILFATCLTSSCTKDDDTKVTGVRLNKTELTLTEGDFETLVATVTPATALDRKVMWSSDDPDVAEVNESGMVTAIKAGETNVTLTTEDGNKSASCRVTVTAISVTGITLNKETLILVTGGSETLTVKVTPDNASDNKVIWTSNNTAVATVDDAGKITAIKTGETDITATTEDEEMSASCSVSVVEGETIDVKGVSLSMIYVKGDTFWMGAQNTDPSGQNYDPDIWGADPVHQVTLSNYYIEQYEVTQGLWEVVTGTTIEQQRDLTNDPMLPLVGIGYDYPMYYVSWEDVVNNFLPKLNQLTGRTFVLPTEAQWEFAARGGINSKGYKYSGSDNVYEVAWYEVNSSEKGFRPVGTKSPNELGIYDMSGNAWEWCSDWYRKTYPAEPQTDPQGPENGYNRVFRGGSWGDEAWPCRIAYRDYSNPDARNANYGLRLVLLP